MKKLSAITWTAACAATVMSAFPAGATITNIVCNPADYTVRADGNNNPISSGTDAIGLAGVGTSWCAILMFPLPTLPAGKVVGNQTTLKVTLSAVGASISYNGDLWGVANFRNTLPTATPDSTYYYYLSADAGPGANATSTDTKLVDNWLTPSLKSTPTAAVTTVPGATNTIQNYIQGFYDANPGYDASVSQAYVWFRINLDGASTSTANRYVINAGEASTALKPTLNLDVADPPRQPPLVWNGDVSAAWDINTSANWKSNSITGLVYQDGTDVLFDDTLAGNSAITLNTVVAPTSVTFNNTLTNYLISGTGKITGTNGLTKLGTNTVILDTDNDYSGGTTLAGGILQVGNGDAHGSFGTGPLAVTVSGLSAVFFNRTDAITANTIANGGGNPLVVVNSGSVTLGGSSDNVGTAAIVNSGATLVLGKPSSGLVHALGTSTIINPGGTLALGGSGGDQIFQNAVITNNGTFDLAGLGEGFNGMAGVGIVTNSVAVDSALALGDGGGSAEFDGAIVDGAAKVSVIKTGNGVQTLAGTNTYTGATTVNAGKLVVFTAGASTGVYNIADTGILGVNVANSNATLQISALNAGTATLELKNVTNATTAPLTVASLTLSNTLTINIVSGNFVPGQSYPLLTYTAINGGANFNLGTLPAGVFANLDTSGTTVKLQVTSTSLTWNGNVAGGIWDIGGAANWKAGAVTGLTYPDGEIVTFNDSLSGTSTVDLESAVSPASVTFSNNVTPYTLTGSGIVTGPTTFIKIGTNTLIVDTDNDYYGGTILAGGTLQVGNGDTHGTIGFGSFTNLGIGSILAFNRTDSIAVGNITRTTVDNSATVVVNSGIVSLGGNGDNSGTTCIINSGGTLVLAKNPSSAAIHALSSPNLIINPGGVMQLGGSGNDQLYLSTGVTDNGVFDMAGFNESFDRLSGSGVVSNSTGGTSVLQLGENNGSVTFAGSILNGAGILSLKKIGTGTLTLTGASTYTGDTLVMVGKLLASTSSTGGGNYTSSNGATFGVIVATNNSSLNSSAVTLGITSASSMEFQNLNSTTTAAITTPNLTVNGPVTVNVTSGTFVAGQTYPLLAYSSLSGSGSFALGMLPPGVTATLNSSASPISLTVSGVINKNPPTLSSSFANGTLTLQWPADHTGFLLQSNSVSLTATNSWFPVVGSTNGNSVSIPISTNTPQVFYRLRY